MLLAWEEFGCQAPAWSEPVQPFVCKCLLGGFLLSHKRRECWRVYLFVVLPALMHHF